MSRGEDDKRNEDSWKMTTNFAESGSVCSKPLNRENPRDPGWRRIHT